MSRPNTAAKLANLLGTLKEMHAQQETEAEAAELQRRKAEALDWLDKFGSIDLECGFTQDESAGIAWRIGDGIDETPHYETLLEAIEAAMRKETGNG